MAECQFSRFNKYITGDTSEIINGSANLIGDCRKDRYVQAS